jgi:Domain of unknown function (DUF4123)/FHA domain
MFVLLETKSGPSVGKRCMVVAGQAIRVGRTSRSDFVLPEDEHMSGVHFEIELEESACRVTDLNSRNGTLLNGQRITVAVIQNGDTITAGETVFQVTVEQAGEAVVPGSVPVAQAMPHQRLLSMLRNDYQPLYAILDAARDIKILALLMQSKEEHQSLYEGVEGAKLAQFAPYLVRLGPDSLLLGSLLLEGWGNNWGVYLTCAGAFPEVRRHLRRFLEVQLPDGKQVYFRFYDPRVLRVFLPTCNPEETGEFFGPIEQYLMEDEKPDKLLHFANPGRGAEKKVTDLLAPQQNPDDSAPEELQTLIMRRTNGIMPAG